MRVFTDGACSGNGKQGARAGWGVWFPDNQSLSSFGRVPDDHPQTNNRAELLAISRAVNTILEKVGTEERVDIYSDSEYSIHCLTKWLPGWKAKGWKTATGTPVKNRDLIEDITTKLVKFPAYSFHHVRAHTGAGDEISKNNDIVDKMAQATLMKTNDLHQTF